MWDGMWRWGPRRVLFGILLLGLLGLYVDWRYPDTLPALLKELSNALIIAGILGFTIETYFRRQFSQDAFQAAYRYILPEEFKEEARRVIGYKLLCTQQRLIISISKLNSDLVAVGIKTERKIENISRYPEKVENKFAIDDWGHEQKSKIARCSIIIDGIEHS
jgi:hypothetical protein